MTSVTDNPAVPTQAPLAAGPAGIDPPRPIPSIIKPRDQQPDHAAAARHLSNALLRLHQAENELMLAVDHPWTVKPSYADDVRDLAESLSNAHSELAIHCSAARDLAERSLPTAA